MFTDTLEAEINRSRELRKQLAERRAAPLLPYRDTPEWKARLARYYEQVAALTGAE